MSFVFSTERAAQAAAYLLGRFPRKALTRGKLLKLLYLADRKSLCDRGFPITGSTPYAMQKGPILSEVYDLIKGSFARSTDQAMWFTFFESRDENVVLKKDPGYEELSDNDLEILDSIIGEFGDKNFHQLSEYTHGLEEFQKSHRPNTSNKIGLETILEAVGKGGDVDHAQRRKALDQHLASLFGN